MSDEANAASPDVQTTATAAVAFQSILINGLPEWLLTDAATLRAHSAFQDALQLYATSMISQFEAEPERVHAVSEEALLFVGLAVSAMYLTRDPADPRSGAAAARARTFAVRAGLASPNRVSAYVGLMMAPGGSTHRPSHQAPGADGEGDATQPNIYHDRPADLEAFVCKYRLH